jgi:hypothetical protein
MAYAATATNDSAGDVYTAREYSAFLRLRQGGAARTTWLVTEAPGGTMISVGADAACDWQIRAAFVPPRAFSILAVGGRAFVRSGPEPGLLLDGKPVDDGWVPLAEHARIDIGLARFEVRTGYADEVTDEPVLELGQPRARKQPEVDAGRRPREQNVGAWAQPSAAVRPADVAIARTAVVQRQENDVPREQRQVTPARTKSRRRRTMETQEYGPQHVQSSRVQRVGVPRAKDHAQVSRAEPLTTRPAVAQPQKVRNSTIELNLDDLDYLGTIPMPRHGEHTDRYSVSPSLLGSDEITRVTGRARSWRYVGMATFFASAYGAWLYLLDRI